MGSRSLGGGPHHQPDLEEILKRSQDKLKQVIPGGSGLPGSLVFLLAVVAAAVLAFYAFTFRVNADELGIVMFFGKPTRASHRVCISAFPTPSKKCACQR